MGEGECLCRSEKGFVVKIDWWSCIETERLGEGGCLCPREKGSVIEIDAYTPRDKVVEPATACEAG